MSGPPDHSDGPRERGLLFAAIALGLAGIALILVPFALFCLRAWDRLDDAEFDAALARYWEGARLDDEGRYAEAAEHYRAFMEYKDAHGVDSDVTALLGYTLHRAGRSDEGEPLIDLALARLPRAHYAVYKAHVLAARAGVDAALAWLATAPLPELARLEALASFRRERGEHAAALAPLREWLARLPGQRFFVDGTLRVPEAIDVDIRTEFAALTWPLEYLADSELRTGDMDRADEAAAHGIAVGQALDRDKTYVDADYIRAGSFECRCVRARVAIARGDLDAAAEHLRLARAHASWGRDTRRMELITALEAEFAERGKR